MTLHGALPVIPPPGRGRIKSHWQHSCPSQCSVPSLESFTPLRFLTQGIKLFIFLIPLVLFPLSFHRTVKLPEPWRMQNCSSVDNQALGHPSVSENTFPSRGVSSPTVIHSFITSRPSQSRYALDILFLLRAFSHRTLWRAHQQRLGTNLTKGFPGEQQCSSAGDTSAAAAQVTGMSREKVKASCFGFSPV